MTKRPSKLKKNIDNLSVLVRPYNLVEQVQENTCNICKIQKYLKVVELEIAALVAKDIDLQEQINNITIGSSHTDTTLVVSPETESLSKTADNQRIVNEEVVSEINKIENGEINYPQIILNGEVITTWPNGTTSNSSDITDNSQEFPDEGINPWKAQIDNNSANINNIINGSLPTSSITNMVNAYDSAAEGGENQYIINLNVQEDLGNLDNRITTLEENGGGSSNSSEIIDDSTTNPTEGINPWKVQIDTNTSDISDIEQEITNITDGTTLIPQNTDNVVYTILNNSTTEALGDFVAADPRLYDGSTNDTVVRDNTLLNITDQLQDQIDVINGDGGEPEDPLVPLIPLQEPPEDETLNLDPNYEEFDLLFIGDRLIDGKNGQEILYAKNLEIDTTYFCGLVGSDGLEGGEMRLAPSSTSSFNITKDNTNFDGVTYLEGLKYTLTPLLEQEGSYGDSAEVNLIQNPQDFNYLLFKSTNTNPNRITYELVKQYNSTVIKIAGSYGQRLTIFGYWEDNYFSVYAPTGTDRVNMVWGINFTNVTNLIGQTFNPTDYDLIILTFDQGINYLTTHYVTKHLILDGTTEYRMTSWGENYTITFTENGYITNAPDLMAVDGIKLTETPPIDCGEKVSICEYNTLEQRVSVLENQLTTLYEKIEELEEKNLELERERW